MKTKDKVIIIMLATTLGLVFILFAKTIDVDRNICNQLGNESYYEGFDKGYFNGSRDYLVAINQEQIFPCLNFKTGEYHEQPIGGLCKNGK